MGHSTYRHEIEHRVGQPHSVRSAGPGGTDATGSLSVLESFENRALLSILMKARRSTSDLLVLVCWYIRRIEDQHVDPTYVM
jgi:hypothetical protein